MFWREYWGAVLVAILLLPIVCSLGFWFWVRRHPAIDPELGVKSWDVFIKFVSALTVIVSGAMLFGKYIDERAIADAAVTAQAHRELALREAEFFRQKLAFETQRHDKKVKLLGEAKSVAARIASSTPPAPADVIRFEELFHADLIGMEKLQGPVEQAMVRFRRKFKNEPPVPDESLRTLSLRLSAAVEEELAESEAALLEQHRAITKLVSSTGSSSHAR